ncbi:extracellular solute-binding protein [Treponema zioleckii]|uniref:extracellular solute-binding protein n=1 Tax=Treponema zioleckii TaxID=331680 RepID=UPI00168A80B4|nr:extracellular solute-binding protein [Treponema zioleckii]
MTSILVSCGEKKGVDNKKLTKIELWYVPSQVEAAEPPENWFMYDKIRQTLGVNLVLRALPSDSAELDEVIQKAAKTNSLPDIFRTSHSLMVELAKQNKIACIDKIYPLMPIRSRDIHTPEAIKASQIDGLSFALAYPTSNTNIPRNEGVLIRKDWLQNLQLEVPRTTDEFFDVMVAFTKEDPDGNGKADTYGFGAFLERNAQEDGLGKRFAPFFGAFGVVGTLNYAPDNPHLNIRDPRFYLALEYVKKMYTARIIDPDFLGYHKDDFRRAWKNGRFGIMREQFAAYSLKSNYTPFDEKFPNGEWIVIDPPVGPRGESSVGLSTQAWNYLSISRRSVEQGKLPVIANLLEWLYTSASENLLYGQLGLNYIYDTNGKISDKTPIPELSYTSVESAPLLQMSWLVEHVNEDKMRERYPIWQRANKTQMDPLAVLEEMQSKHWTVGFTFESMPKALNDAYNQGLIDFLTGKRNLTKENFEAFIESLDEKGLKEWEDKIISDARENGLLPQ